MNWTCSCIRWSVCVAVLTTIVAAQKAGEDVTADFRVPDGLAATVWATTPQVLNPTNMAVDAKGRIWVTEAVNYRDFRNAPEGRLTAPKGDRVRVLQDTDGDGVCDASHVFVQDEDLVAPLGIAVIGARVFVSCSPRLIVYTDTDGDLRADDKEVLLEGFGGFDHDHGLHAVVPGPDGRLWFNTGNAGPHIVTDRGGWTLRSGSAYDGGGPKLAGNVPGLVSDDGKVWVGGLALSMRRDGTDLRVHSHNYRNSYEITVDAWGDVWQNDNDDDGNRGCRIARLPRGANMGYYSADGTRSWGADRRPGQATQVAHWHQDDPGVFPAGEITGAGAPTGITFYETGALGEAFEDTLLSADAGRSTVFMSRPALAGAGFAWKSTSFLSPSDPEQKWFRPADVTVGIDGAVYVADWWDPVVGGHLMRDVKGAGRIYRIAPRGAATTPRAFSVDSATDAAAALAHPVSCVRDLAGARLRRGEAEELTALRGLLLEGNGRSRARALWILAGSEAGRVTCRKALEHPVPRLRITAFRALVENGVPPLELASTLVEDPHPAVRTELALHLRDINWADSKEVVLALFEGFDGEDRTYLEALGLACEGEEATAFADIAAKHGGDDPLEWSHAFAALAWRLHPPAATPGLAARALTGSLPVGSRRRAIDALGFSPTHEASASMVAITTRGPEDLRPLAHFWLRRNDSAAWRGHGAFDRIGGNRPAGATPAWTSGIMKSGTREGVVDLTGMSDLWLEVTAGGDGNACDWADWVEPVLHGPSGATPLTELPWNRAQSEWGQVNVDRNCVGRELSIGGKSFASGLGAHARSEIHYTLPEGRYTRLTFRVGPDDGGTSQQHAPTTIEFRVFATGPGAGDELELDLAALVDEKTPARERRRLAKKLAGDARGGMALIGLAAKDALPGTSKRIIEDRIHRNPDLSVRALASRWFPRSDVEGTTFPSVDELLALEGDPDRGRAVFFGQAAACASCHAHDERGADIGPDLTAIHAKYARAEILDAILNPSAGIAFGYEGWMIETEDGKVHTGFLLADGPLVILKDTDGTRTTLRGDEVTFRRKLALSTMPDNVALGLTPQQLMDVVSFLRRDVTAAPAFGPEVAIFNGEDLDGWTHHSDDGETTAEEVWTVEDGVLSCRGNPIGYLRTEADFTDFELTLEWRFDPARGPGNSGVLLRKVGEDRVWPRSIEAQLMHRNAGDIWNIGEFGMAPVAERTRGRRTEKAHPSNELPLGQWNRYRIRLHGGRLTLAVNGVIQNRAWDCERVPGKIALQSEGAAIQFRNIRLRPILD